VVFQLPYWLLHSDL